jgi:hypothetical protein
MQLGLEVVDVALGGGQLILSMLQPSAGIIKEVGLEVTAVISPHHLIVHLLDMCFKAGILLKKLSVTLLNVLDDTVLSLHLIGVLLHVEALVRASRCDLLKQGAHVLGIACHERTTRMVGRKLGVTNSGHTLTPHHVAHVPIREQGDSSAIEDRQVVLTELHEGLVGSPLQSVIKVVVVAVVNQAVLVGSEG